jgi:hypothetical protein
MLNFAQIPIYKSSGFHPFYKAILLRAAGLGFAAPSITWQIKQNALVERLVRQGIWVKLDFLNIYYADSSSGFTLINWVNPTGSVASNVSATFVSLDGWTGTGGVSGPYVDTNWTESVNGVNWQLNNCSFFIQVKENNQEAAYLCGAQPVGTNPITRFRPRNTSDVAGIRIDNTNNEITFASVDSSGLWHVKRNGTNVSTFRNGSSVSSVTNTGDVSLTNVTHNVLRPNTSGATASTKTVRCYATGDALVGFESALYNAINDYLN